MSSHGSNVGKGLGNVIVIGMLATNNLFFHTCPHPPPPSPLPPQTQIDFEDRKINDIGNDCLMSINGTDFRIPQTGEAKTGNWFASHKYSFKSALRYEIGISIIGGDLVWIQGPYPAGHFNDIAIFKKVLRHFLKPGERVESETDMLAPSTRSSAQTIPATQWKTRGCSPAQDIATRHSTGASRRGGYSSKRTATTSDGTARFFGRLQ